MRLRTAGVALVLALAAFSCNKKKVMVSTPPAPSPAVASNQTPAPPAPRVNSFNVYPQTIAPGATATLRWSVNNANRVTISGGVGSVEPGNGSQSVSPMQTTVYNLTASGPGGSANGTVTLNVAAPASASTTPAPSRSLGEMVESDVKDVHFAYNASAITEEAGTTLASDASALKQIFQTFPNAKVTVEGHCDERGSAEYNLALGDRRAQTTRDYLSHLGVPETKLDIISYGKEKPLCTESTESCWARNRRAHFTPSAQ